MAITAANLSEIPPDLDAEQIEYLRSLPSEEKFRILSEIIEYVREEIREQLRAQYPAATPEEIFRRCATVTLGAELASKVYGPEPDPPTINIPVKTMWYIPPRKSAPMIDS